jgi:Right handed beta helix region
MTKNLSLLAASMIALLVASSPALAASSRTFVSGTGSDTGTCPLATPCRTFAYALTQTAPSGEIIVLSSAGYGAITITQAVSIINTSNFAGVTVASGNGITINANISDAVTLRGLTIDGAGTGSNGIVFNSGGKLTIDQCDLQNFGASGAAGVLIQPSSGYQKIVVTNSTASNNGWVGVEYLPTGNAMADIVIDHVSANNNNYGISINNLNSTGAAKATITNTIGGVNGIAGFFFGNVTASLDSSNASDNGAHGIYVNSNTQVTIGRSVLMNNSQYGVYIYAGSVLSYKDNRITGNGNGPTYGSLGTATLY